MRYISARSGTGGPAVPFRDVLLEGLAPDGGLYVPAEYPRVDATTLATWRALLTNDGYPALAHAVLTLFVDDIPHTDLAAICALAYRPDNFGPTVVPVTQLADATFLAQLSNGPTAAFKDMAMQLLGQLFEYELAARGETLAILGATSGDTGSAAEHAMLGKQGITTFMLTPRGRMSPFQQAQMYSIDDPATVNVAVDGVFDDCQDIVKAISADLAFKARWRLGTVNSINWARLAAQVVYYVAAWVRVTSALAGDGPADDSQTISFVVPTGNFGNICAGHVARQMGLPIDRLILATNENDVLAEFFATGRYRVRAGAETRATSSPSMDISKASNFERFVFDLLGRDADRVRELFATRLAADGCFDLSADPAFADAGARFGFWAGRSTHADRIRTIRDVYSTDQVVVDPHTADGIVVGRAARAAGVVTGPLVALETALPVKFADTIAEALGFEPDRPARFRGIEDAPRHVVDVAADADAVKALIVEHLSAAG